MKYLPYPDSKTTPSRLTRKQQRKNVFLTNKRMAKITRKARKVAREEALEAAQEAAGE